MQTFIDRYEIDVYGYISITNVKYLVFKLETRLNPVSMDPGNRHMRKIFEQLQNMHVRMLLNPFFDFDQMSLSKSYQASRITKFVSACEVDEETKSDYSSESNMSSNSEKESPVQEKEKNKQGKGTQLNSKEINQQCLEILQQRVDRYVKQQDAAMRK